MIISYYSQESRTRKKVRWVEDLGLEYINCRSISGTKKQATETQHVQINFWKKAGVSNLVSTESNICILQRGLISFTSRKQSYFNPSLKRSEHTKKLTWSTHGSMLAYNNHVWLKYSRLSKAKAYKPLSLLIFLFRW